MTRSHAWPVAVSRAHLQHRACARRMPAEAFKAASSKRSSSCSAHRALAAFSSADKRHARIPSMDTYTLLHLSDQDLLRDLLALVARDRENTAALLAHLAEVDSRGLYLSAA